MTYCTVQDISNEMRTTFDSSSTPSDTTITEWISQASALIEEITGTVWEQRSDTGIILDYDGSGVIFTPYKPIISIDSLKVQEYNINSDTQSTTTLTEGRGKDFIIYKDEGEIHFLSSTNYPKEGKQRILLDYTYGYATTPYYIKKLCIYMVVKRVISSILNSQTNQEGGSVRVASIEITDPSMFSINYIKFLNQEIDSLLSNFNKSHAIRYIRYKNE